MKLRLIKTIGHWFRRKAIGIENSLLVTFPGLARWMRNDYVAYATEGYIQNVYVYAGVSLVARACAGIDWVLFQQKRNGTQSEVTQSPLMDIMRMPNPQQDRYEFVETLVSYLLMAGVAYVYGPRVGAGASKPKELYLLRPDRVRSMVAVDGRAVVKYEYNGKMSYPAEEVLCIKYFHPLDELDGLSPLTPAARSIDQNNESRKWNVALLQNSAQPSGAYSTEHNLGDEQYERLKNQIPGEYAGSRNAGRPLLLEGGLKWQATSFTPQEMSWLEGSRQSAREVGLALGVAPELLGDPTVKTYASYREARKSLYTETILPIMDRIMGKINGWLCPLFGEGLVFEYNDDDIEALREDRDGLYARLEKANFLTINEKRAEAGFEAVEGGDVIVIPNNLTQTQGETTNAG